MITFCLISERNWSKIYLFKFINIVKFTKDFVKQLGKFMGMIITLNSIIAVMFLIFVILTLYLGIKIVPQSKEFVVERFGKYSRTLPAGLSIIVPYLDKIAHRISILEKQ